MLMKTSSFFLCGFLVLTMLSCSSTKSSTVRQYQQDSLLVAIERGACFGACPEFKAIIYKSGLAVYSGRRNVNLLGSYNARLTSAQMDSLLSYIRAQKVEALDTAYVNPFLADYPAYFLWISDVGPTREILISNDAPPEKVKDFTKVVENIVNALNWKKVSDQAPKD